MVYWRDTAKDYYRATVGGGRGDRLSIGRVGENPPGHGTMRPPVAIVIEGHSFHPLERDRVVRGVVRLSNDSEAGREDCATRWAGSLKRTARP